MIKKGSTESVLIKDEFFFAFPLIVLLKKIISLLMLIMLDG